MVPFPPRSTAAPSVSGRICGWRWPVLIALLAAATVTLCSCRPQPPQTKKTPQPPADSPSSPTGAGPQVPAFDTATIPNASPQPASDTELPIASAGSSDRAGGGDTKGDVGVEPRSPGSTGTEPPSEDDSRPPERLVLLVDGGPVVVDLHVQIDGESPGLGLERLVELALEAADEDGDGTPTWEEITNGERFRYGQFGNLAFSNEDEREQVVRLYDANRDGIADPGEIPRFLTRNAGRARPFSLTSSNQYRSLGRMNSPLRRLLDSDGDGSLDRGECAAASSRLLQRDANDDQILTPAEVAPSPQLMNRQLSNMRRRDQPDTAFLVEEEVNWAAVRYVLAELYSFEGEVQEGDWPGTPGLFAFLDENGDGQLEVEEVRRLRDAPPHLVIRTRFGYPDPGYASSTTPPTSPKPTIELLSLHTDLAERLVAVHRYPQRFSLELPDTELEFFVNEDAALSGAVELSDRQFKNLDRDDNGYLDETDVPGNLPGMQGPLAAADFDGDGKVYPDEFRHSLELRQAAFRGQVRGRTSDQPDTAFTALDTDGDGLLRTREIERAPRRLARLDRNGDELIQAYEIPGSMVVGFVRGNPQSDDSMLIVPMSSDSSESELPDWFRGMDANGDRELSHREFLGRQELFVEFDANQDGFLTLDEVNLAENP